MSDDVQFNAKRNLFNLRVLLTVSAIGWGISFFAAFAPWPLVVGWIKAIGNLTPPDEPMIQYWVRMAGAGCQPGDSRSTLCSASAAA